MAMSELSDRFGIETVPALILFTKDDKNEGTRYKGMNDLKEMFNFVNKHAATKVQFSDKNKSKPAPIRTQSSPVMILSDHNFDHSVVANPSHVVVLFTGRQCEHCKDSYPVFQHLADMFKNTSVEFGRIDGYASPRIPHQYEVNNIPVIKLFQTGKKQRPVSYGGSLSLRQLVQFVNRRCGTSVPAPPPESPEEADAKPSDVMVLTENNFDSVVFGFGGPKTTLVKFYAPWCGHCKRLAPVYEQLATLFKEYSHLVAIADVDATEESELGTRYNVSGYPTLKFFTQGQEQAEEYNHGRDLPSLVRFINERIGTSVEPPEEPEPEQKGAVVPLSDKSFDRIVMDPTKHVLVKFYAPWCGHCKAMAPAYEQLAEHVKDKPSLVIAEMDATKYEIKPKEYGVNGFPTLKWFPKDDKSGLEYNSGRDFDSMLKWVSKPLEEEGGDDAEDEDEGDELEEVVTVSDENFAQIVEQAPTAAFVRFYSQYCGMSRALSSTWEQLAVDLKDELAEKIIIVDIDISRNKGIATKYDVKKTPTLKFFAKNDKENPVPYTGATDFHSLAAFVRKQL